MSKNDFQIGYTHLYTSWDKFQDIIYNIIIREEVYEIYLTLL